MLSVRREVPFDAQLPQLTAALDPRHMARVFDDALRSQRGSRKHGSVASCDVAWVKYKPGKSCLVNYRLTLCDSANGQRRRRLLTGRIYRRGSAYSRYLKAQQQPLAPSDGFPPLWHVAALDMVVWPFPNERKLRGLAMLSDHECLRGEVLPELVRARWGERWALADAELTLMHYAPEHTAAVRAVLTLRQRDGDGERSRTVFGKAYPDEHGDATRKRMLELWHSPARRAGRLSVPRPLCYQPHERILWQQGLPGQTLLQRFPDGAYPPALLEQIAVAVVALQQTPLPSAPTFSVATLCESLQTRAALLAAAVPEHKQRLERLLQRLLAPPALPVSNASASTTLHGDLHPQNLLLAESRVALIDLDRLCQGPPLQDLSSWLAALYYRALLLKQPGSARRQAAAFVAAYRQHAPWPVPAAELNWFTAAALINERAFRCLSRLKAGRLSLIGELIALAERISDGKELCCHE